MKKFQNSWNKVKLPSGISSWREEMWQQPLSTFTCDNYDRKQICDNSVLPQKKKTRQEEHFSSLLPAFCGQTKQFCKIFMYVYVCVNLNTKKPWRVKNKNEEKGYHHALQPSI